MVTSSRLLTAAARAATALQLLGLASAAPPLVAPGPLEGRSPDATMSATATATTTATDAAWVSVGASGTPVTVTPLVTVVDGTTTTLSAVPNDLTATVVTRTGHAEDTTSTGTTAPGPTATGADGSGSFLVCDNADGEYAPFCQPVQNSSLYPGTTYYVTWDSSIFNATNTTVVIEGSYTDATTGEITSQAFSSPEIAAGWSYYAWTVDKKLLRGGRAVNITLLLNSLANTDTNTNLTTTAAAKVKSYSGPTVLVTRKPTYQQPAPKAPTGAALYIGLPTVLGFCVLMLFGVCMWNRKARHIGLGNVMSRGRNGGGARALMRRRLTRRDKKQAIRLTDQGPEEGGYADVEEQKGGLVGAGVGEIGVAVGEVQHYRDEPPSHHSVRYEDDGWGQDWGNHEEEQEGYRYRDSDGINVGIARRDSDALGSLAGTPTSENFPPMKNHVRY